MSEQNGERHETHDGPTLESLVDIVAIDPECYELDLNHHRVGKIENLEPLVNVER